MFILNPYRLTGKEDRPSKLKKPLMNVLKVLCVGLLMTSVLHHAYHHLSTLKTHTQNQHRLWLIYMYMCAMSSSLKVQIQILSDFVLM